MELKKRLRIVFAFCSILILAPIAVAIILPLVSKFSVRLSLIFTFSQLAASLTGLFIIYTQLLQPVLRLNKAVTSVLNSPEFKNEYAEVSLGEHSLLDHFQILMDREYASRISSRQAELDALQSQINPHFLYNTLECIRGQAIVEGAGTIADMARALSDFFRYSINRKEKLVTLEDEYRNIEAYLKIQNYRFKDKYRIRYHIDQADISKTLNCKVPRMTLQPIVENALLHGVRDSEREVEYIDISAVLTDSQLILRISDNGVGMTQDKVDLINARFMDPDTCRENNVSHTGGIALSNINERIKLSFGPHYGLRAYSDPGLGCTIEIVLPQYTGGL